MVNKRIIFWEAVGLIQKILVGVHGLTSSEKVLDFAMDLAEKFNASVTILNVSETPTMETVPGEPTAYTGGVAAFTKELQKIHEEILSKAVAHANATHPNLAVTTKLLEGDPASEIVDAVKEGGFDVVVVGHRGGSGVREFLLGSVSEKVAHSAVCTAIIVR
jgi:nucleotide-binding universal stress UspA family protein